ncbi:MAG: RNA pseudouridine synthase, partial [Erysipelotrichaceae bacterium]|nr:RNA pseudouridine synthase [Erysipelotrichaceae bacterium]
MDTINFIVDEELKGERIDKALLQKAGFSRTRIQQLIDEGLVTVNDQNVKSNYKLRLNDEVIMEVPEAEEYEVKPYKMDLDIRYEDQDII